MKATFNGIIILNCFSTYHIQIVLIKTDEVHWQPGNHIYLISFVIFDKVCTVCL